MKQGVTYTHRSEHERTKHYWRAEATASEKSYKSCQETRSTSAFICFNEWCVRKEEEQCSSAPKKKRRKDERESGSSGEERQEYANTSSSPEEREKDGVFPFIPRYVTHRISWIIPSVVFPSSFYSVVSLSSPCVQVWICMKWKGDEWKRRDEASFSRPLLHFGKEPEHTTYKNMSSPRLLHPNDGPCKEKREAGGNDAYTLTLPNLLMFLWWLRRAQSSGACATCMCMCLHL